MLEEMNLQISEMLDMFDNETENEICSRAENREHIKTQNVVKANFLCTGILTNPKDKDAVSPLRCCQDAATLCFWRR